jgi:hypothetical protein
LHSLAVFDPRRSSRLSSTHALFTHSAPLRYAFVEFTSEKAATAAVMGANGTTVKGREISVAISNPPKKDRDG